MKGKERGKKGEINKRQKRWKRKRRIDMVGKEEKGRSWRRRKGREERG